jgi:hypothetical protein
VKRVYSVNFDGVSVSAVQDLIGVYAGASMAFEVHSITLGQITATAVGNLRIALKRLPATVTSGSGGSAVTPQKTNYGDAAATVTARSNDTTVATSSGAVSVVKPDVYNVINGYQWIFPHEDRPIFQPSQACILSLETAPGSAETMSAELVIAELF